MAVSTSALNYAEYALIADVPERNRVAAMSFIKYGSILEDVVVKTENTLESNGMRYLGFSNTPGWLNINEEPSVTKNVPQPWAEQKYMAGFTIPVSKVYAGARGSGGRDALINKMIDPAVMAHTFDLNYKFFNNQRLPTAAALTDGTGAYNTKCFNGLRYRLTSAGRTQYGIPSECKITSGSADLTSANISSSNVMKVYRAMLNAMEIAGSPDGEGCVFYANQSVLAALEASPLVTAHSLFGDDTNMFGQRILTLRNAKIKRAGRQVPDVTGVQSQILANTESSTGDDATGGSNTSIFMVRTGEKTLCMNQFKAPGPDDPRQAEDGVTWLTTWWNLYGLEQADNRSICQIYGITCD